MNSKFSKVLFFALLLFNMKASIVHAQCPYVPNYSNSYINSTNPGTIEYDNIVSTFHSTMARQADGKVRVWGEIMASDGVSHVLTPQVLNAANYPGLTGNILKFTGGSIGGMSAQFAVLTTTGLFTWGALDGLVNNSISATTGFQKITVSGKTDGLPAGVFPENVKMLFGSFRMLGIVTCSGDVWVLVNAQFASTAGSLLASAYGDGSTYTEASMSVWHKVKESATKDLTNVTALRGGGVFSFMALKTDGTVWTWGYKTYLGDGSGLATRYYATQMQLPTGVETKMIGMNTNSNSLQVSYYILSKEGAVYGLGNNSDRELGDFTNSTRTSWVRVQKSATAGDYLTNIVWISPIEHDGWYHSAVNALQSDGTLWSWGLNEYSMLGQPGNGSIDPVANGGGLAGASLLGVETGGHTSIVVKECSAQFGYVGHRVRGSMGDGSAADVPGVPLYNFTETSVLNVYGAESKAAVLFPVDGNAMLSNTSVQLDFAPVGGTFNVTGPATITADGLLTSTGVGRIEVSYTIATPCATTSTISLNSTETLAVTFGEVRAEIDHGMLTVNWSTLKESNNDHFEVQTSVDGKTFVTIATVQSKAVEGNSNETIAYAYTGEVSAITIAAGLGLLLMGGAGLGFTRRRHYLFIIIAVSGLILGVAGCNKNNNEALSKENKLFVRIAQVDKDGTKTYSRVVGVNRQ